MAAKLVVIALAFCSASASVCMPVFSAQDACQTSFPEVFNAPSVTVAGSGFVSAPSLAVGGAAPFVSGPGFGFSQDFADSTSELALSSGSVRGPQALPVIRAPPVTLSPVESPVITLPSPAIPAPQVIRHKCYCTKTIIKPQIVQRTINVPRIQRYLKRTYRPVVENIAYSAKPVGGDSQGQEVVIGGSAAPSFVSGGIVSGGVIPSGVVSGGIVSGGVIPSGVVSGGIVSGGVIPSGVVSGGIVSGGVVPTGVVSGISGSPFVESSEASCEQVVPSFPRCY